MVVAQLLVLPFRIFQHGKKILNGMYVLSGSVYSARTSHTRAKQKEKKVCARHNVIAIFPFTAAFAADAHVAASA